MTVDEWTVVTVLVGLAGLFATVAKPIVGLNSTIARLSQNVERLEGMLKELNGRNADGHRRLGEESERQARRLEDHETRLAILEQQKS